VIPLSNKRAIYRMQAGAFQTARTLGRVGALPHRDPLIL
jgi:hypothetical protein